MSSSGLVTLSFETVGCAKDIFVVAAADQSVRTLTQPTVSKVYRCLYKMPNIYITFGQKNAKHNPRNGHQYHLVKKNGSAIDTSFGPFVKFWNYGKINTTKKIEKLLQKGQHHAVADSITVMNCTTYKTYIFWKLMICRMP